VAAVSLVAISLTVILVAVLVRLITKNTTVALATAVVLEGITLAVYLIDNSLFQGLFPNILQSLSLYQRFYTLLSGVLDLGSFVYYISVIVVMLFMSVQSMEKRRWSE
jgi:ABC-2 type transport system permease protein